MTEAAAVSVSQPPAFGDDGRRILSRQELAGFQRQGFLTIPSLAPPDDILAVRRIIDRIYAQKGREHGCIENLLRLAPELQSSGPFTACSRIAKQLLGRTAMYACDSGLYKEPHGKHGTPWHQDGAFHGKYFPNNTLAFWIPLQDVALENGCMHYIPLGRHQILLPHHPYYPNDYRSMATDDVNPGEAIACPLRIGDAAVHGPLTLHSALANSTDFVRRTWVLTFRPWGKWGSLAPSRLLHRAVQIFDRINSRAAT